MSATRKSRVRFTPATPGPVAHSFARYVSSTYAEQFPQLKAFAGKDGAALAQAIFSYHSEWQRWRNLPGGEADQETEARKSEATKKMLEANQGKVASALELVQSAWLAAEQEWLASQEQEELAS